MFSGSDLPYKADPAQPLTTAAGDELDHLDHDRLQIDHIDHDLSETCVCATITGGHSK